VMDYFGLSSKDFLLNTDTVTDMVWLWSRLALAHQHMICYQYVETKDRKLIDPLGILKV
jgi:hypothetical protein